MAEDVQHPDEADQELLATLRTVVQLADPVPERVQEAARASFTWRTVDAELAELAYDSLLDDDRLAGVRGDEATRTLTFEGPSYTVELEVAEEGDGRRLLGQLVPPAAATIEVRHSGGLLRLGADEVGRFSATGVAAGPMSLRCQVAGADGPPLHPAWVTV